MLGGRIGGGKTNQILSDITTSVVAEKAVEDMRDQVIESTHARELEESDFELLCQRRLEEMKASRKEIQENISVCGHGDYTEIAQDEFLPKVTASKLLFAIFIIKTSKDARLSIII